MIRLPDINANRQSIFVVEFTVIDGNPNEIQRILTSTGLSYAVSNSRVDTGSQSGKLVLTGWGNTFEPIAKGMRFTCNDRSVIEVTDCRYVVRGSIDDLHPAEMSVMNNLLGADAPNKFIIPNAV